MNNHNQAASQTTPECAAIAAILPLLDDDGLVPRDADRVREHLAGCSACQAQRRAYTRLNIALRRHFGLAAFAPLRTEEIMGELPTTDTSDTSAALSTKTTPDEIELTELPPASGLPGSRRPRRVVSVVAPLAAVVLIALFATLFYVNRAGPAARPRPSSHTYMQTSLTGISMVSPDEGWMIGNTATMTYTTATQSTDRNIVTSQNDVQGPNALLYHYNNEKWTPYVLPPAIAHSSMLRAISMDSPTDGWAAGLWFDGPVGLVTSVRGLLLHYDGTTWHQVPSPVNNGIAGIHMLSATNGWAYTDSGDGHGLQILRYNGSVWQVQHVPASATTAGMMLTLTGVEVLPDGQVWIAGQRNPCSGDGCSSDAGSDSSSASSTSSTQGAAGQSESVGVILHYDGASWTVQTTVANSVLNSVAMAGPDDGWAVGEDASTDGPPSPATIFLHYSGGRWTRVAVAVPGDNGNSPAMVTLNRIALLTSTNGWVIGSAEMYGAGAGVKYGLPHGSLLLLHYDGSRWTQAAGLTLPANTEPGVADVAFTSSGDGWAVGWLISFPNNPDGSGPETPHQQTAPLLLHYTNGTWTTYNLS